MTPRSRSPPTSGQSANKILFLLSGEETSIPAAEARALVRMQDPDATFTSPRMRVLIAATEALPGEIEARIAYSRRVGTMVSGDPLDDWCLRKLRRGTYAVNVFNLARKRDSQQLVERLADEIGGRVALGNPDVELTVVRDENLDYFAVTEPARMSQRWVVRRPRARAFFHPSAIFPKFSRLMVNLSRVAPGETLLDPFCGTGSLLLEASEVGAVPIGIDLHSKMTAGAVANCRKFGQEWAGVLRADSRRIPLTRVDAIATDIPYGRVSTTSGSSSMEILENLIKQASLLLAVGRRLVVMHPDSLKVRKLGGFEIEEQHSIPVHKKLTRVVTVLRRC